MNTLRYRVTFKALNQDSISYYVATLFGEQKAIVLAAQAHFMKRHALRIHSVEISAASGDRIEGTDLVDRAEW